MAHTPGGLMGNPRRRPELRRTRSNPLFGSVIVALLAAALGFHPLPAAALGCLPTGILADEATILSVFRDSDEDSVRRFAREIAARCDGIVVHLGRRDVFSRGGLFFYRTSRRNLKVFCDAMKADGKKVYLWSLDSFGAASFQELAEGCREAIAQDVAELQRLQVPFDGWIADLEWINLPDGDNAGRLLEVLGFLRELLPRKELLLFAPVIDDPAENVRRGYRESDLLRIVDNLVPMLYVRDAGFTLEGGELRPHLNPDRIEQLRRWYRERGYRPAVSIEGGLIVEREGQPFFVKTIVDDADPIFAELSPTAVQETRYYRIATYRASRGFPLVKNDGATEAIRAGETVHWLRILGAILEPDDFLWEYTLWRP